MKNLDGKKLLVLIGIILVVAVIVFVIVKAINNNGITEEDKKQAEENALTYFVNLTENYKTPYNGIDKLFQLEETTFKTLSQESIVSTAIKYAKENDIEIVISDRTASLIKNSNTYPNFSEYDVYKGESIREIIKKLFGNVEFSNYDYTNKTSYLYEGIYDNTFDVYLIKRNNVKDVTSEFQSIKFSLIDTKIKDKKIVTTIAVAYVYDDGANIMYAQDKNGKNVIAENVNEFPTDKIDEFDKFEITSTKTEEGNIVFESIKKVK